MAEKLGTLRKLNFSSNGKKPLVPLAKPRLFGNRKVTVVGTGQVGAALTFALLSRGITNDICLIDTNVNAAIGQKLDFLYGTPFMNEARITAGNKYAASAASRVCVIAAGMRQERDKDPLLILKENVKALKMIIPKLVEYSPTAIFLVITSPIDSMTYATWRLSGLPKERVIGTGTYLDSARFRQFIAQRLNVAPSSCHAWIIGEHGSNSVPVWSGVSVGGVLLSELNPYIAVEHDADGWDLAHEKVVKADSEVIYRKGYINWSMALTAASLVEDILDNNSKVATVSTLASGQQDISDCVFLSLPCVIGANGISAFVKLALSDHESKMLTHSVESVAMTQESVDVVESELD